MKYIKIFELFELKPYYNYKLIPSVNPSFVVYSFDTDNYTYVVEFERVLDGWSGLHEIGNPFIINRYKLTNDNALKVTSTVICILKDFISNNDPNFIYFNYIPTDNEDANSFNKMNKRSILQSHYLKQIKGYNSVYFHGSDNRGKLRTLCLFYKDGYNIDNIVLHIEDNGFIMI